MPRARTRSTSSTVPAPNARNSRYHRPCAGRWRAEVSLGRDGSGKRRKRKLSGQTKTAVKDELDKIREEIAEGIRTSDSYTLQQAVDDWLADGMSGRSDKTITKYRHVLQPVLESSGGMVLRDLTAPQVRAALRSLAATHATGTVSMARLSLERAIRHAEAAGLVRRNVAALVDAPKGQAGGRASHCPCFRPRPWYRLQGSQGCAPTSCYR